MNMKLLLATAASIGTLAFALPAGAVETVTVGAYTLDDTSFGTGLGVHSDGTQSGSTVSGHVNQDGSDVTFEVSSGTIDLNGQGEAIINGDPLLEDLLVTFEKSWGAVTFTLESPTGQEDPNFDFSDFTLTVNGSTVFGAGGSPACTFCIVDNGENKFTVSGPGVNSLYFTFDPAIGDAKQFRVEFFNAIPEPATWAMMIMGFGGVGAMLRNRRRRLAFAA
jgi:hypothetical protein